MTGMDYNKYTENRVSLQNAYYKIREFYYPLNSFFKSNL